ncbi:hypothetical protein [Paenibacillus amylolyticus]|uniref:hypothetical protein n=1 Tax=Paenibacillus amylolyticus TaxID=1451 RepID=UPI003EBF082D
MAVEHTKLCKSKDEGYKEIGDKLVPELENEIHMDKMKENEQQNCKALNYPENIDYSHDKINNEYIAYQGGGSNGNHEYSDRN